MKLDLKEECELGQDVTASLNGRDLTIKGPKGEVTRTFLHPRVLISVGNSVVVESAKATKREKKMVASYTAHIKNMIKGVQEPFVYILKICSGHFPMNVSVSGDDFTVKNFLGESVPRKIKLLPGSSVKVDGTKITVCRVNKEIAGQNSARIENLCKITDRDLRIFQDGIYITEKAGKAC